MQEKELKCNECIWCSLTCSSWQRNSLCVEPERYKNIEEWGEMQ